jgi:hypothetical protein
MGYYVYQEDGMLVIEQSKFKACYEALCNLNARDDLKRGGGWGGEISSDQPRPEGIGYHPARWFSWMDADYPFTCSNLLQVLQQLGFECEIADRDFNPTDVNLPAFKSGDLCNVSWNGEKMGQEDLFFEALAPFISNNSFIEWRGEDNEMWRWLFKDGTMVIQKPVIFWHPHAVAEKLVVKEPVG